MTTYPRKRRIWPAVATVLAVAFCAAGLLLAVTS